MKSIKFFLLLIPIYIVFCLGGSGLSSCTKTNTVHDTTTVHNHDTTTLTITDTLTIKDTVVVNDNIMNDIKKGMIAYYNFNGGNLNDSSGNFNNIVFNNATLTADRFGNQNNAYLFNGTSSYMRVTNNPSLNPQNITIYAIVKPLGFNQATCHGNQILSKGYPYNVNGFYDLAFFPLNNSAGGAEVCAMTVDTTKEVFGGGYGDNNPQGSAAGAFGTSSSDSVYIQKNQWYTLVYTYDGTTSRFYVNGALASSNPNTHTVNFASNSFDIFIGKHENPQYPYYLNGVIDEIRIYNRSLTNREVGYLDIFRTKYLKSITTKKILY
ncbi:MAG: LamG domain-containing protein [Bacteroidota bacterium]|nr:LamG domain-containing protein [Bacteroidota bacterium]